MSPDLIEQLHRVEYKLDKILEYLRIKEYVDEDIDHPNRTCPNCELKIKWGQNKDGEVIRKCGCIMRMTSLDYKQFAPPTPKKEK
jgi:hypothetical protein